MTSIDSDELPSLMRGLEKTRFLVFASMTLVVLDSCLTFSQEVKYFWSSRWSIFRVLFHVNRICVPCILVLNVYCLLQTNSTSHQFCTALTRSTFLSTLIAIVVIQLSIVLRIFYSEGGRIIRALILLAFSSGLAILIPLAKNIFDELGNQLVLPAGDAIQVQHFAGCGSDPPKDMYKVYIPNTVLQGIMFATVVWSAIMARHSGKFSAIMARILRDEGVFFLVALGSSFFSVIGAFSRNWEVSLPAMWSGLWLATSSVAMSRLMLSARSLAPSISSDPDLLLSMSELSRVRWTPGARKGEIHVEVDAAEDSFYELQGIEDVNRSTPSRVRSMAVHMTRVGIYEDDSV